MTLILLFAPQVRGTTPCCSDIRPSARHVALGQRDSVGFTSLQAAMPRQGWSAEAAGRCGEAELKQPDNNEPDLFKF